MALVQRTCAGCNCRAEKESLLRFVISGGGELVADPLALLPGRGVYVHYRPECLLRKGLPGLMSSRLERQSVRKDKKGVVFTVDNLLIILEQAGQCISDGCQGRRKVVSDTLYKLVEVLREKKLEGRNELNGGHRRKIRI
ncbi:MAG: YlxR family protein [bacterium]|nr:YlxR family protein [bacterium]